MRRRKESSTGFYHVVVKGIARERNFSQTREKKYFRLIIRKHLKNYDVKIYAYCIMSNHAHIMIWAEIQELSFFMARVLAEYANYYNYKHDRNGHVFQNRFTSECIEDEDYFWNCLRYIHMNPVKAGMAKKAADYKYSSIKEYFSEEKMLIHEEAVRFIRNRFGEFHIFEAFHQGRKYEVFEDIKEEIEQQRIDIAEMMAHELCEKNKFDFCIQVFEEKVVREEYLKKIQQTLDVSCRKSQEIYSKIRKKMKSK